jgi:hypothetical protein
VRHASSLFAIHLLFRIQTQNHIILVPMKLPNSLCVAMLIATTLPTFSADPAWWTTRGVKTTAPASNLSPATIGQAKHMAAMALAELETHIPASAYAELVAEINTVVDLSIPDHLPPDWQERHRAPLLTGQLKALAKLFYDKLHTLDSAWTKQQIQLMGLALIEPGTYPMEISPYPWTVSAADDANKALATMGQLKAVFSIDFSAWGSITTVDTDGDGLPDEIEVILGTSPTLIDSDHDGVTDQLDAFPLDPSQSSHGSPEPGDLIAPVVNLFAPANAVLTYGP